MATKARFSPHTQQFFDHILSRPELFVGSGSAEPLTTFIPSFDVHSPATRVFKPQRILFNPSIFNIVNDLLSFFASVTTPNNQILVHVDPTDQILSIWVDTLIFPIAYNEKHNVWIPDYRSTSPTLIDDIVIEPLDYLTHPVTKRVYKAHQQLLKVPLFALIHAQLLSLQSVLKLGSDNVVYTQTYYNNMQEKEIQVSSGDSPSDGKRQGENKNNYSHFTTHIDFERFKTTFNTSLTQLIEKRCYELAAISNRQFVFNGVPIAPRSFLELARLHVANPDTLVYGEIPGFCEFAIGPNPYTPLPSQVSFVNTINTIRGGTHVDTFIKQLMNALSQTVHTLPKPNKLRSALFVFVSLKSDSVMYQDSNKDSTISLSARKLLEQMIIPESFITALSAAPFLVALTKRSASAASTSTIPTVAPTSPIPVLTSPGTSSASISTLNRPASAGSPSLARVSSINPRPIPTILGKPKSQIVLTPSLISRCLDAPTASLPPPLNAHSTLIITQNEFIASAAAIAISQSISLKVTNQINNYGIFSFKSRPINVFNAPYKTIVDNVDIIDLTRLLGLPLPSSLPNHNPPQPVSSPNQTTAMVPSPSTTNGGQSLPLPPTPSAVNNPSTPTPANTKRSSISQGSSLSTTLLQQQSTQPTFAALSSIDPTKRRYGRVMVMCDNDTEGFLFKALVMSIFILLYPSVIQSDGFFTEFVFPTITVPIPLSLQLERQLSQNNGNNPNTLLTAQAHQSNLLAATAAPTSTPSNQSASNPSAQSGAEYKELTFYSEFAYRRWRLSPPQLETSPNVDLQSIMKLSNLLTFEQNTDMIATKGSPSIPGGGIRTNSTNPLHQRVILKTLREDAVPTQSLEDFASDGAPTKPKTRLSHNEATPSPSSDQSSATVSSPMASPATSPPSGGFGAAFGSWFSIFGKSQPKINERPVSTASTDDSLSSDSSSDNDSDNYNVANSSGRGGSFESDEMQAYLTPNLAHQYDEEDLDDFDYYYHNYCEDDMGTSPESGHNRYHTRYGKFVEVETETDLEFLYPYTAFSSALVASHTYVYDGLLGSTTDSAAQQPSAAHTRSPPHFSADSHILSTHSQYTPGQAMFTPSHHKIEHPSGYKFHQTLNSLTTVQLCNYFSNLYSHQRAIYYHDSSLELFKFYLSAEFASERTKRIHRTVCFPGALNPHSFAPYLSRSQYELLFPKETNNTTATSPNPKESSINTISNNNQSQPDNQCVIIKPLDHFYHKVTYSSFLKNELFSYYISIYERSIPSLADGYLPIQRQLLYTLLCLTIESQSSQFQSARLFAQQQQHHSLQNRNHRINRGFSAKPPTLNPISIPLHRFMAELTARTEAKLDLPSLTTLISRLAQTWSHNYPFLQLSHPALSGTKSIQSRELTSSAGSASLIDGIELQLSPLALALFNHDDFQLYQHTLLCSSITQSSTSTISPPLPPLQPIIPTILLHCVTPNVGTQGSHQASFLRYKLTDLINNVRLLLSGIEPLELFPFYNCFTGEIKTDTKTTTPQPAKYVTHGKCVVFDREKCIICVTELPLNMTGAHFKSVLLKKQQGYEIAAFWEEIKPAGLNLPSPAQNPFRQQQQQQQRQSALGRRTSTEFTNSNDGNTTKSIFDTKDENEMDPLLSPVSQSSSLQDKNEENKTPSEGDMSTATFVYFIQFSPEIFTSIESSLGFISFLNLTTTLESPLMWCFTSTNAQVSLPTTPTSSSSLHQFHLAQTHSILNNHSATDLASSSSSSDSLIVHIHPSTPQNSTHGSSSPSVPATPPRRRQTEAVTHAAIHSSPFAAHQTALMANFSNSVSHTHLPSNNPAQQPTSTSQNQNRSRMEGTPTVATTAPVIQTPQPPLEQFLTVRDLFKAWFQQRLQIYHQRKFYLISRYEFLIQYYLSLIEFTNSVISGELNLYQYTSPEDTMVALMSCGKYAKLTLDQFQVFSCHEQANAIERFIQVQYQKYRDIINQRILHHSKKTSINNKLSKWSRKAMGFQMQQTVRHDSLVMGNTSVIGDRKNNVLDHETKKNTTDLSSVSSSTSLPDSSTAPGRHGSAKRNSVIYAFDDDSDSDDERNYSTPTVINKTGGGSYNQYRSAANSFNSSRPLSSNQQSMMRFTDEDLAQLTQTYGNYANNNNDPIPSQDSSNSTNLFAINPSLTRRLSQHLMVSNVPGGSAANAVEHEAETQSVIKGFEYLLVVPPYEINPATLVNYTHLLELYTKLLSKLQQTTVQELWLHDLQDLETALGLHQ